MSLRLSVLGVRGRYMELFPERVLRLAQAFSTYLGGGPIALGNDPRPSGRFIREAVISGLLATGADVHDYGVIPTPVLQWIIRHSGFYRGGISLTGEHNPFDWNAMLFLNGEGSILNHLEGEEFFNLYHADKFARRSYAALGTHQASSHFLAEYFQAMALPPAEPGPARQFVVDCVYGAGGAVTAELSRALHVKLIPLFNPDDTCFPRDPEPNPANAAILATVVRETHSDGGFLLNSDGSRLLIVDETGRVYSEELTLPFFAAMVLEEESSPVVTSYSTSRLVDAVAARFGVKVQRTDVGPSSVVLKARELSARIAGEGSGHTLYTPFSYGYDSFYFMRRTVQYLRRHGRPLSEVAGAFPTPAVRKEKIPLSADRIFHALERIERLFPDHLKLKDGFYIPSGDDWMCIRVSSTEYMIRLIGEGRGVADVFRRIREEIQ